MNETELDVITKNLESLYSLLRQQGFRIAKTEALVNAIIEQPAFDTDSFRASCQRHFDAVIAEFGGDAQVGQEDPEQG